MLRDNDRLPADRRARSGARSRLCSRPLADSTSPSNNAAPAQAKSHSPRWYAAAQETAFGWLLLRWGTTRLQYRALQSAAASIALTQSLIYLLADQFAAGAKTAAHLIASTTAYSMWLGVVAAAFLLSGFVGLSTERLMNALGRRRQISPDPLRKVNVVAIALWLGMLLGAPVAAVALVAIAKAHSMRSLVELTGCLGQSLVTVELFALLLAWSTQSLRHSRVSQPRTWFALVLLGPELIRLLIPELPTVRTLIAGAAMLSETWSMPS